MKASSSLEKKAISAFRSSSPHLVIRYIPTASVKLNPDNPRTHSDKQVLQIARSIENLASVFRSP
jgi:hypothetical protein